MNETEKDMELTDDKMDGISGGVEHYISEKNGCCSKCGTKLVQLTRGGNWYCSTCKKYARIVNA